MVRRASRNRDDEDEDRKPRSERNSGRDRDDEDEKPSRSRSSRQGRSGGREKGGKFKYRERDSSTTAKRATQRGNEYPSVLKDGVKEYRPQEGKHRIRVLPPTWDDPEHFAYDIHINYRVGADGHSYLSRSKMLNEDDPILEERERANRDGDEEYAKSLVAKRRCAMYVIDRKEEDSGPQLWLAPWTFDRDLSAQALDDETGAVLALDHPDEGYDISFSIEGKGLNKKYTGVSIARRDSDLGRDGAAWLEQIEENPVPECLVFASYEDIAKAFTGGANKPKRDDDDDGGGRDRKPSRGRDVDDDDDGDDDKKPRRGKRQSKKTEWGIDEAREGDNVFIVVDGEEIEGEILSAGRKDFEIEFDGDDGDPIVETYRYDDVEEAELIED